MIIRRKPIWQTVDVECFECARPVKVYIPSNLIVGTLIYSCVRKQCGRRGTIGYCKTTNTDGTEVITLRERSLDKPGVKLNRL